MERSTPRLDVHTERRLSDSDKIRYWKELRTYYLEKGKDSHFPKSILRTQRLISFCSEHRIGTLVDIAARAGYYGFEVNGVEYIKSCINKPVMYLLNHTNIHDFPTTMELFHGKKGLRSVQNNIVIKANILASEEGLNDSRKKLFTGCGAILIDRYDKESRANGIHGMLAGLGKGVSQIVFPEGTWNRTLAPMLPISMGSIRAAAIMGCDVIPITCEYLLKDPTCRNLRFGNAKYEREIYEKVVVNVGKPISTSIDESIIEQAMAIEKIMAKMRIDAWRKYDIWTDDRNTPTFENYMALQSVILSPAPPSTDEVGVIRNGKEFLAANMPKDKDMYRDLILKRRERIAKGE